TQRAIELQFLGEAIILGLVGGVAGILASLGGASSTGHALAWPISISVRAVAVAVTSSIAVGLCAGFYPAWRAARLDPIEALRHEERRRRGVGASAPRRGSCTRQVDGETTVQHS